MSWNASTWNRLNADPVWPHQIIKSQVRRTKALMVANGVPTDQLNERVERSIHDWWAKHLDEISADVGKTVKPARIGKIIKGLFKN